MINSTKSLKPSQSFSRPLLDIANLLSRQKGLLKGRQVSSINPPSEATAKISTTATAKFTKES